MQATDFVTVGMFGSRPEAEISRARLEFEGIEALVSSDDAGGYEPPLGLTNGVRLLVRASFVASALGILEPSDDLTSHRARPWILIVAAFTAGVLCLLVSMPLIVTVWRAVL